MQDVWVRFPVALVDWFGQSCNRMIEINPGHLGIRTRVLVHLKRMRNHFAIRCKCIVTTVTRHAPGVEPMSVCLWRGCEATVQNMPAASLEPARPGIRTHVRVHLERMLNHYASRHDVCAHFPKPERCLPRVTVRLVHTRSTCSVAVSCKPPMLATRARLSARAQCVGKHTSSACRRCEAENRCMVYRSDT